MRLQINAPPEKPSLSLSSLKSQLGLEPDFTADDPYLDTIILAASEWLEDKTSRKFITQTWDIYFENWPSEQFDLPFGQLQQVNSIQYYPATGNDWVTWDSSSYDVMTGDDAIIKPSYNVSFPSDLLKNLYPIKITFTCGYGNNASAVPSILQMLMLKIAADMYENREIKITGTIQAEDKHFQEQVGLYRLWWI